MSEGVVYLVGAGPGDPGLLTVKGRRCVETADVVVHDRLVDRRILRHARERAEVIDVGKVRGQGGSTQPKINSLLVQRAKEGRKVVRLKGGDPFVFGRGGEEADALQEAGVAFQVVPGVTSAIAAPAYAGIPLTHRGVASAFTVVTGTEAPGSQSSPIEWGGPGAAPRHPGAADGVGEPSDHRRGAAPAREAARYPDGAGPMGHRAVPADRRGHLGEHRSQGRCRRVQAARRCGHRRGGPAQGEASMVRQPAPVGQTGSGDQDSHPGRRALPGSWTIEAPTPSSFPR